MSGNEGADGSPRDLRKGTLLAYLGDDYTGSSAVMEVMTFAGLPTVMFIEPPDADRLQAFASWRGIGIATSARAESPEWMDAELPAILTALKRLGAPVNHYKVCSTFDSSPCLGSIGRAIDLGASVFGPRFTPLVTGAPAIRRYQAFGHLFAGYDGATFRLDRHPSMSRHPTTPMIESDLGLHLSRQTDRKSGLVDLAALKAGEGGIRLETEIASGASIVSFDVLDEETLARVGEIIWRESDRGPVFAAGSQGVEYALIAHWRAAGLIPAEAPPARARPTERIAVVSGSVSPTTAAQIADAVQKGFDVVPVDIEQLPENGEWADHLDTLVGSGLEILRQGRSPLIVSARGPDDPAVARFSALLEGSGGSPGDLNRRLSQGLGRVLSRLMREGGVTRGVICGGDTSSFAARELGIDALSAVAPIAPGAPLCRGFGREGAAEPVELALKGGQMGERDYLSRVRAGCI